MKELSVINDLPITLHRSIGKLVAKYAHLEYVMQTIVFELVGLSPEIGRTFIRQPRAKEVYDMIKDLAFINEITLSKEYDVIGTALAQCETERDMVAHGVWMRDRGSKSIHLRITSGTWQPDKNGPQKIKRRITPEAREYGIEEMASTISLVEATIEAVWRLKEDLKPHLKKRG